MPAFLLILLALNSCAPTSAKVELFADDTGDGSDDTGDGSDDGSDTTSRLEALEGRMSAAEEGLAECREGLAELEATVTGQAEQLAELEATVAGQAEQLAELEATVASLGGGTSDDGDFDAVSQSAYSGGSGTSWGGLTSRTLTVSTTEDSVVVAFCSFTHGTASGSTYRVKIESEDGDYTDDAEVVGDSAYAGLSYSGENLTVWGFWTVPDDGDYTITCEGKYGAAYDITFAAWTR